MDDLLIRTGGHVLAHVPLQGVPDLPIPTVVPTAYPHIIQGNLARGGLRRDQNGMNSSIHLQTRHPYCLANFPSENVE